MKTLNLIVVVLVAFVLSVLSFGCGDSDSLTAGPASPTTLIPRAQTPFFSMRDPVGDVYHFVGSGGVVDLTSLSLTGPDSGGWITAEFTTSARLDAEEILSVVEESGGIRFYTGFYDADANDEDGMDSVLSVNMIWMHDSNEWGMRYESDVSSPGTAATSQSTGVSDTFTFRFTMPSGVEVESMRAGAIQWAVDDVNVATLYTIDRIGLPGELRIAPGGVQIRIP